MKWRVEVDKRGSALVSAAGVRPVSDLDRATEALSRIDRAMVRLVDAGLERLTQGALDELGEVERAAHHGRLTRLERELAALSGLGKRYLARDPSFAPGAWAAACERVAALSEAARRVLHLDEDERAGVVGTPRRSYQPVDGVVRVFAIGASGWVTESGFCGITVHLWDGQRLVQATQARPTSLVGSDPRRLLYQPISEDTPLSIQELSHGAWDLDDVRLSRDGRVSLHAGLKAVPAAPIGLRAYEPYRCADVVEVVDRIAAEEGSRALVFLEIADVRAVGTDETHARGVAEVVDRAGNVLEVQVPLRPENDLLLENLVRIGRMRPLGLFGAAWIGGRSVRLDPYTAVFDAPVSLAARRRSQVQEVHLSIEALPGDVAVPAVRGRDGPEASPDVQLLSRALRPVGQVIERLYGTGIALPEPALVDEVRFLAERWAGAGADHLGADLTRLADALTADRSAALGALAAVGTRTRLFREALAIQEVRLRQTRSTAQAEDDGGETLALVPVGPEVAGGRVWVHALDAGGGWVVVEDDWLDFDRTAAFERRWPSRLFQDEIDVRDLLSREILLERHPVARSADRRWVRPSVRRAARLGERRDPPALPQGPTARLPFRARAAARRDPSGWWLEVDGLAPVLVDDEWLQIDLEKRAVDEPVPRFEVTAILRRGEVVVLGVDGRWPTIDPAATAFHEARLRKAAGTELIAAVDGQAPPVSEWPADDSVAARVAALGREVRGGAVLPPVDELRALADAWCRVRGWDRADRPVRRLELPRERVWLAIVGPVARWLAGGPGDATVREALILAAAAGERGVIVR